MQSRKSFIRNIGLAVAATTIDTNNLFAAPKVVAQTNLQIIVLDAVRKSDLRNNLNPLLAFSKNHTHILYDNLHAVHDISCHQSGINQVFLNSNEYVVCDLKMDTTYLPINKNIVLKGFDVAHYNYHQYIELINKADKLITEKILTDKHQKNILIISSMGRNNYENEIASASNGGLDHDDNSARECWALYIKNDNKKNEIIHTDFITTATLTTQFKTDISI